MRFADRAFAVGLLVALVLLALAVAQPHAVAQETGATEDSQPQTVRDQTGGVFQVQNVRTDSPRQTLATFRHLRGEFETALSAYNRSRSRERAANVIYIGELIISLIDLSELPAASRQETGGETAAHLLDIFNRIPLPDLKTVPDRVALENSGFSSYAIPGTPFGIVQIKSGARQGEFLFSKHTVRLAPWFFRSIRHLPLDPSVRIRSWSETVRQLTGPLIPATFIAAMPKSLKQPFLDTPLWKILFAVALALPTALLLLIWHRTVAYQPPATPTRHPWRRILSPVSIMVALVGLHGFLSYQVNISGEFARTVDILRTVLFYLALTWAYWLLVVTFFERVAVDPKSPEGNLDTNMLRLLAMILGVVGGVFILAYGAREVGLPVFSILAGLGIGGLAIALAIRPTLENLIGGFILFLDRPIRVGDFCTFAGHMGTVERIGVRSTQIRTLERTVIAIPNAQFADMPIINWARCDRMMIGQTVGLRYETDTDQLRYVLAKIREMFHSHPRIDSDTVRVRFVGYGSSSLDIDVRVYADTDEWNDFFAIKEDVLLRIKGIVEQSGTGFAFPSQTLYFGRDAGLDKGLTNKAKHEVSTWRRRKILPFPFFNSDAVKQMAGSVSYPPDGSPDNDTGVEETGDAGEERLSVEHPVDEHADDIDKSKNR